MKLIQLLKKELASEASRWVGKGLLSQKQAQTILKLYGTELPTGEERSVGYTILLSLAALFMGLAVVVVVCGNWDTIPRALRAILLIVLTVGSNGMGFRAVFRKNEKTGRLWLFVGALFYGISILLIADVYRLGAHFSDGIYWWALGVLPLALWTRSILIMFLTFVLSLSWLLIDSNNGFFPTSFPFFIAAFFWFSLKQRQSILIFLSGVMGTFFWLELLLAWGLGKGVRFEHGPEQVVFLGGLFLIAHEIGRFLEEVAAKHWLRSYGLAMRLWEIRVGLIGLLILSFEEPWKMLIDAHWTAGTFMHFWVVLICIVLGVSVYFADRHWAFSEETGGVFKRHVSTLGFSGFFILTTFLVLSPPVENTPILLQCITNLFLVFAGIWLIVRAVHDTLTHYYYLGIGLLILTASFRYFDLIGDYLGASVLFLVCAAILFGAARYWRHHIVTTASGSPG
ncbi:MAG: DUF2157 domain-containing protein [Nitrospiria bacterium]